ncbi:Fur family transcriptional regulator [Microvirga thermotolerans]|uniref:Transcriptional repressor n=1 Tax=Microvirga thermotolerans TaxID=2651334 RepID=A0A5P9K5H0_9HYPH|nr:Fur family transcriptional regulator [Microvirga thermotolerans]QFU17774.1 transcriptional repressor [Microvirga thermotolerans]
MTVTRTALSFLPVRDEPSRNAPCAHAERQAERAAAALEKAEEVCRARQVRLTPIRRRVLEVLYATHKPLGAYEIAERVAPAGRSMAPITVYRALDFLMENGLAHKLASQNAFVGSFHAREAAGITAFLICEDCGGVDEAGTPDLDGAVASLLDREGFAPRAKLVEIVGRCAHCR